jgi:hypothetical protein
MRFYSLTTTDHDCTFIHNKTDKLEIDPSDYDEKSFYSIALCAHSDTNKATKNIRLTTKTEEKETNH